MSGDEPLDGEVLPGLDEEEDPHRLRVTSTRYGKLAQCACYGWDGWWNGPASERYVREEHARHVELSRRAAGE